jgi:hypothetical protein
MARQISKREQSRIDLFKKTFRGISTSVVGQILSMNSPGLDWRDSTKQDMAEGWAREDDSGYYGRRGPHPDIEKVHRECLEHIQRIEARKKRQAEVMAEILASRQKSADEKRADDKLLEEVFEYAEYNLGEMGALSKLAKVIALRKKLLGK